MQVFHGLWPLAHLTRLSLLWKRKRHQRSLVRWRHFREHARNVGNQRESHPKPPFSHRCYVPFGSMMRSKTPIQNIQSQRSVLIGWISMHHSVGRCFIVKSQTPHTHIKKKGFIDLSLNDRDGSWWFTGPSTMHMNPCSTTWLTLLWCQRFVWSSKVRQNKGSPTASQ